MPESSFQGLPFPQALHVRDKAAAVSQLETSRVPCPSPSAHTPTVLKPLLGCQGTRGSSLTSLPSGAPTVGRGSSS